MPWEGAARFFAEEGRAVGPPATHVGKIMPRTAKTVALQADLLRKAEVLDSVRASALGRTFQQRSPVPGPRVSASNVRGDPRHILFCKGLYGHLEGSILHYAPYYEGPSQEPVHELGFLVGFGECDDVF